jgi:hypothetical protein
MLLILFGRDEDGGTWTHPSGWTTLISRLNGGSRTIVYWRIADGSEGSSITVSHTGTPDASGHWSCRITGYSGVGDHFQATASDQGLTTSPDPPSLTPTDGAADYLWICGYHASGNDSDADAFPANYTHLTFTQKYADGTLSEGGLAVAARQLNAASEDPGTFSLVTNNGRTPTPFTAAITFLRNRAVLPWESAGEVDLAWISRYRFASR